MQVKELLNRFPISREMAKELAKKLANKQDVYDELYFWFVVEGGMPAVEFDGYFWR